MRTHKIEVRVTADQKAALRHAAERERLSISGFMMAAASSASGRQPFLTPEEIDALDQLREQLRRAGINLNTLLRELQAFNLGSSRRPPDGQGFAEVKTELEVVLGQVRALLQTKV